MKRASYQDSISKYISTADMIEKRINTYHSIDEDAGYLRVPGGWIYVLNDTTRSAQQCVFVPIPERIAGGALHD